MPKFLSDGIFDGSSTDLTVDGSFRSKGDLNYFGLDNIFNEAEIVINTGNSGSPQIGFTENGDASWAIGVDDADNGFKIHGGAGATIPTINNLTKPFFEIDTIGQIFQRPPTGVGSYTKLGFEVSAQEVALELGDDRTDSGFAYIDLIGDTTYADYGLRLIRWNGGANTTSHLRHRGTGYLEIETEDGGDILINPNSGNVGIFETNPSQKLHVAGNARVTGAYYDSSNLPGTSGQILSSTPTGTGWVDANTIASGSSETVEVPVKNLQGSALTKGDPVYISGDVGASGRLEVKLADAGQASKMPAVGLLKQDLGINGEGFAVVTGKLRNLVTSPIDGVTPTANAVIYVKPGGTTGAALTTVKPTGSNLIQNMGKVGRVSTAADGTLVVSSILRSNDIPNLTTGKIWVGDGNTVESTVVHLDETNGRMGIGETNPDTILHITGNEPTIKLEDNVGADFYNPKIEFFGSSEGGTLEYISNPNFSGMRLHNKSSFPTADTFLNLKNGLGEFQSVGITGGTTLKTDGVLQVTGSNDSYFSNGNVGIGTTGPQGLLHISSDSTPTLIIGTKTANQANSGAISFREIESTSEVELRYNGADNAFKIWTSLAGDALTVLRSNGNVGIGSPNPGQKLEVDGNIYAKSSNYCEIGVDQTDSAAIKMGVSSGGVNTFIDASNTGAGHVGGTPNIRLLFNASEKFRFKGSGNFGIGTTDPKYKLQIGINGGLSDSIKFGTYDVPNNTRQYIGYSRADSGVFETTGNGDSESTVLSGVAGIRISNRVGSLVSTKSDNSVQILTHIYNGGSRIAAHFDANGNVGIGTTSPRTKLHVSGLTGDDDPALGSSTAPLFVSNTANSYGLNIGVNNVGTSWLQAQSNTSATAYKISLNPLGGNVGIGTTNPNQRLTVKGTDQYIATEHSSYLWGNTNTIGVRMGTDATAGLLDFRRWTGTGTTHGTALITQVNSDGGYGLDFRVNTQSTNTTATTSRMFLSTSGEVGIGTTSPAQKLDVAGSVRVQDRLYTNANATNSVGILGKATVNGWASRYDSNNANFSGFYFDGSHHSIIAGRNAAGTITNWIHASGSSYFNGGNVGIGTNNPQTGLHLSSGVDNRTVGGTDVGIIRLTNTYGSNFGAGGEIQFGLADVGGRDVLSLIKGSYTGYDSGNYGGDLEFHTRKPDGLGLQQRMTITDAGNVGIGTANPGKLLELSGGANVAAIRLRDTTSNVWDIQNSTFGKLDFIRGGTNTYMRIDQFGNVGIGATSPQAKLHVSSGTANEDCVVIIESDTDNNDETSNPRLELRQDGGAVIGRLGYRDNTNSLELINQYGEALYLGTSNSTNLTILSNGNVGVGETNPQKKLHVSSSDQSTARIRLSNTNTASGGDNIELVAGVHSLTQDGFSIYNATSAQTQLVIQGGGNVGIGVTSPAAKLDISDTADEVDLTSTTNFAINTGGLIASRHYKNLNLETPEFEWSIGGSTDLNWKKLATIVVSDINYSGFGAEVEITDFSGNFGNSVAEYGDVYRGGLSIYHQGGTGVAPKEGIITIHSDMIPYIRIYKIAGSGNSSYEIQVKSPANYRQINVKLKAGIGNQIADIFSHANNTNGSTSGGTVYTPEAYTSGNQFKTGFTTVTANKGNILYRFGVVNPSPSYPLDVTGTIRATGDVIAYSDIRVKENIKTIDNAVNKVKALRGVEYNKIDSTEQSIGVIAQEIEEVIPQVVREDDQGMKSVAYGNITAVLIEAIKEQQKQIDELKNQLNAFTK